MKNSKKLKLILQILICISIILIGFVGIYTKSTNMYKNVLPQYELSSDINGATVIEFEVDSSTNDVYYDKDGKEVDSTTITEENKKDYEKKEIPVNLKENLNFKNYQETVKIMKKRLNLLDTNQYQLDLDKKTGKITIKVEDEYLEDIESILPREGKLQLIDSNTKDVIIDYTDFKSAETSYASLTEECIIYLTLNLNSSGVEKINNIDKYKVQVEKSKENTEKEADSSDEEAKTEESKLLVMFDNEQIAETSYDEILLKGKKLRIVTASGLTSDSEINSKLNLCATVSKLASIGKMPVVYNLTAEEFIKTDIENEVNYIVIGLIIISSIVSILLIIKHKIKGILAVLGFATNIALFLLVIRYTDIQISLNGFMGMAALIIFNGILANNILNCIKDTNNTFSKNIKKAYLNTLDVIVVMLIIFIVFSFSQMTLINTMGLLLFWGWVTIVLGNLIFTVPMLAVATKK